MKIKRILIVILCFMFIATSCTVNQDRQNDLNESEEHTEIQVDSENLSKDLFDGKNTETVLQFYNLGEDFDKEKLRDTIVTASWWVDDENQMTSIIKTYLQEQEMFKEKPDSIINGEESYLIEYYTDSDKRKTSFIIYFGGESNDFDSICGITFSWDDLKEIGNIIYECNQNGDAVYENFYNTEGEQTAGISYEYFEGVPFPFISTYGNAEDYGYSILNRTQKFWFYKDFAVFDEAGKIAGYNCDLQFISDISKNAFNEFFYDEKGRLNAIREELSKEDKPPQEWDLDLSSTYSTEITLDYLENDKLSAVNYGFFYYNHATNDSSGKIYYDGQGRMIFRTYYITHGSHNCIYLYEGDSKRPWAYIELCSMSYSGEDDYGYGNETSVYLFQRK